MEKDIMAKNNKEVLPTYTLPTLLTFYLQVGR